MDPAQGSTKGFGNGQKRVSDEIESGSEICLLFTDLA
jgi:hypothetical protein